MTGDDEKNDKGYRDLAYPLRIMAGTMFGTIVVLTIAQVFFRFVLDSPLIWSEELARILLVWTTFIGAVVVCWDGTHLNVDVFFIKLPPGPRRWVRAFNALMAILFLTILAYFGIPIVEIAMMTDTGALELPTAVIRGPAVVGGILMICFIALRWFYRLPGEKKAKGSIDLSKEPM
jgi:TRAP-type transport system small permease protein